MDDGQGLGYLGVLGQAVNPRAVVHAVAYTVVNSVSRPSQEGDSLIGTGTVRGRVGPGPASGGVKVSGVGVRLGTFGGWSGDGLGEKVPGEVCLQVEEVGVFVEKPTVACVGREATPLIIIDEGSEGGSLSCPALAVAYCVFLSLFFFITVTTDGARIGRGVGAGAPLLGVVTTSQVVEKEAKLPGRTFGSSFGARQPCGGKGVEALPDRG